MLHCLLLTERSQDVRQAPGLSFSCAVENHPGAACCHALGSLTVFLGMHCLLKFVISSIYASFIQDTAKVSQAQHT